MTSHFFDALVTTEHGSIAGRRSATFGVSLVAHAALLLAVVIVPLALEDVLPTPGEAVAAFFVTPQEVAPPPPPPPPPAAGPRPEAKAPPPETPPEPARFTAPVEVPETVVPEEGLDLGVEGGVPGGVEGGVPGGVVGGIVGGLPLDAPPPPRVVRVGGQITAPKLLHEVKPEYPALALQARLSTIIIMEAQVGTDGRIKSARVLRGHPLFDESALAAVRQRRYAPLLLNGEPTEFILTVTVTFRLEMAK